MGRELIKCGLCHSDAVAWCAPHSHLRAVSCTGCDRASGLHAIGRDAIDDWNDMNEPNRPENDWRERVHVERLPVGASGNYAPKPLPDDEKCPRL